MLCIVTDHTLLTWVPVASAEHLDIVLISYSSSSCLPIQNPPGYHLNLLYYNVCEEHRSRSPQGVLQGAHRHHQLLPLAFDFREFQAYLRVPPVQFFELFLQCSVPLLQDFQLLYRLIMSCIPPVMPIAVTICIVSVGAWQHVTAPGGAVVMLDALRSSMVVVLKKHNIVCNFLGTKAYDYNLSIGM
jgi:hypothetical protein